MSTKSQTMIEWVKTNLLQLIIITGMIVNFYLVTTFSTKTELTIHIKEEIEAVQERTRQESILHSAINANLSQLTLAIAKLEFNSNLLLDNQKQITINTSKMAALEIKLAEHDVEIKQILRATKITPEK